MTNTTNDKPGPELNIRIEETLFGCKRDKHRPGWVRKGNQVSYPQSYSTTWQGMQLVVEEMMRREFSFQMGHYINLYTVSFVANGIAYIGRSNEAPMAVVLACLSALEGKRDE